jgi:hypothetical protein
MKHGTFVVTGLFLSLAALVLLSGCSPALHRAARTGDYQAVQRLLEQGADPEEKCSPNAWAFWTPLEAAARNGHTEVVGLLLDRGADINAHSPGGSALHWAATGGHADTVHLLLERGADFKLRDGWRHHTPLDDAKHYCGNNAHPQDCARLIALLEGAAMKEAVEAAREEQRRTMEEEQAEIRRGLDGGDLAKLLSLPPKNGQWAEALTERLIQAKNTELPVFLTRAAVEERVKRLTTVELRISQAQSLIARLNAQAEDAVRNGQSAASLREQAGKVQVYSSVLSAIRALLLGS